MKGVKGSTKSIGDPCADCGLPLTAETIVMRSPPRKGALSYCRPCMNSRARRSMTPARLAAKRERDRAYRTSLRQQVQDAYGNRCKCCGETTPEFLALNHVEGGGAAHRREMNNSVAQLYRSVIREGFPATYQLLCHNCNLAKGFYGQCPHERERNAQPSGPL